MRNDQHMLRKIKVQKSKHHLIRLQKERTNKQTKQNKKKKKQKTKKENNLNAVLSHSEIRQHHKNIHKI